MPSKFEYELTKLRGTVSENEELYTDTIAALEDKITTLETTITTLDADLAANKQTTNTALRKATKAISDESGSLKKSGSRLDNNCWIDNFQASNVIAFKAMCDVGINIHDSSGAIIARIGSTAAGIKADIVAEYTAGTGVTLDGVLLKDSEVTTDVINEKTSDTGVTLDSVLLKDNKVRDAGLHNCYPTETVAGNGTNTGELRLYGNKLAFWNGTSWEAITSAVIE